MTSTLLNNVSVKVPLVRHFLPIKLIIPLRPSAHSLLQVLVLIFEKNDWILVQCTWAIEDRNNLGKITAQIVHYSEHF